MLILCTVTTTINPGCKKVSALLDSSSDLSSILTHIETLRQLQKHLCSRLDPPLNQHITIANFHRQTLIVHTDSSAWAAKLRFKIPDILDIVRNNHQLTDIQTVRIKVMPVEQTTDMAPPAKISRQAAGILRQVADNISDPALRSSLHNLSNNID